LLRGYVIDDVLQQHLVLLCFSDAVENKYQLSAFAMPIFLYCHRTHHLIVCASIVLLCDTNIISP